MKREESIKMFYHALKFLVARLANEKVLLGRWGYHWEIKRTIQKYYD